jgi:hypothetical protein
MGNLFVVGFDEPNQAEEVHFKLQKLQSEGLLDLADVAVAVKDETGKAKLHHAVVENEWLRWPKSSCSNSGGSAQRCNTDEMSST